MKQTRKELYLSQKTYAASNAIPGKKPLAHLEKLVLLLLFLFLIASPLAFLVNKDIMVYVGLLNYFILGLAILVKPALVIDLMRKNRKNFDQTYEKRITKLMITIRLFGIFFVAIGGALLYFVVLQSS